MYFRTLCGRRRRTNLNRVDDRQQMSIISPLFQGGEREWKLRSILSWLFCLQHPRVSHSSVIAANELVFERLRLLFGAFGFFRNLHEWRSNPQYEYLCKQELCQQEWVYKWIHTWIGLILPFIIWKSSALCAVKYLWKHLRRGVALGLSTMPYAVL